MINRVIHVSFKAVGEGAWGKAGILTLSPCIFLPIDKVMHPLL